MRGTEVRGLQPLTHSNEHTHSQDTSPEKAQTSTTPQPSLVLPVLVAASPPVAASRHGQQPLAS